MGFVVWLLVVYAIWDLNYFIRCICTLGYAHFFQKKRKVTEKTTIYSKFMWLFKNVHQCYKFLFFKAFVRHKM